MDILTENDKLGEYPNSYYVATAGVLPLLNSLEENLVCDVCVVGGGYTGLSTSLSLSEMGYSVVLLEAQRVAFGASGRNGGQVSSGQQWNVCDLHNAFGREKTKMLWDMSRHLTLLVMVLDLQTSTLLIRFRNVLSCPRMFSGKLRTERC